MTCEVRLVWELWPGLFAHFDFSRRDVSCTHFPHSGPGHRSVFSGDLWALVGLPLSRVLSSLTHPLDLILCSSFCPVFFSFRLGKHFSAIFQLGSLVLPTAPGLFCPVNLLLFPRNLPHSHLSCCSLTYIQLLSLGFYVRHGLETCSFLSVFSEVPNHTSSLWLPTWPSVLRVPSVIQGLRGSPLRRVRTGCGSTGLVEGLCSPSMSAFAAVVPAYTLVDRTRVEQPCAQYFLFFLSCCLYCTSYLKIARCWFWAFLLVMVLQTGITNSSHKTKVSVMKQPICGSLLTLSLW